ncbi:MAG: tetratricopeptide repeat protein [Acidobacteria bacterium]|nr:MAG: tetratricopeptide repeat protein [Acidobacteriota bacterium]
MSHMKVVLVVLLLPAFFGSLLAADAELAQSYYHFTLARMYSQDKQFADALAEYEKAIKLNPESSELRVHQAMALYESTNYREFVTACEKAIELDPQNPEPHFLLGRFYFTYRESPSGTLLDKALTEFERVIELDPKHVYALDYLSRLYVLKENWEKASELLARVVQLRPSHSDAHYLRALALVRLNKTDEAVQVLEKAVEYDAADLEHLKLLGGLYLQRRETAKAVEVFRKATEMDPRGDDVEIRLELAKALNLSRQYAEASQVLTPLSKEVSAKVPSEQKTEANFELAKALAGLGRRSEAVELFKNLLDTNLPEQSRPIVQTRLALLYQESKEHDKAIQLFRQVHAQNTANPEYTLNLAFALKDAGNAQEALGLVDQYLSKHPEETYFIVAKGQILGALGRVQEAVDLLTESGLKQEDPEPFVLAASQLYIDHKRYPEAAKIIKKGLEKLPDSETMQFQLGAIYERQEQYGDAETSFKKVLEKNPRHAPVLNYLGYMLADRGIRLDEAKDYINRAVALDPHNGAYLDSLGWVYFKLKEYEQAERFLRQAVELNGDDSTILEHLGDVYGKLGRYDEAGQYYEKSVSQSKESDERKRVQGKLTGVKKVLSQRRQ